MSNKNLSFGASFLLEDGTSVKICDFDYTENDYLTEMKIGEGEWEIQFLEVFIRRVTMKRHLADLWEML